MSPRQWKDRIRDILDAVDEIESFAAGLDRETFCADVRTQRAVEMNFIVIGEAAGHVGDDVQEAHPHVPWHLMRAMRNRLVHVYFNVDPSVLWQTMQDDLPVLAAALRDLLAEGA